MLGQYHMKKVIFIMMIIGSVYANSESNVYNPQFMQTKATANNVNNTQPQTMPCESLDLDASARFQKNLKQQLGDMIQNFNQAPN